MRVLQLLPELNAGGVETGTLEIARSLVQAGHESIVISAGGRLVKSLKADGIRHISLPIHKKRLGSLRQVKTLRAFFEAEKPDVLHLRSRLPAWLARLALRKMSPQTRPRLVSTVHGFYSVNAYSKIMTCGEVVICVSNSVKNYILKNYPNVPEKKLAVIHRGDLREIMAVSDAVVSCAAKPETFGRVTLEALSMGIPVAGYDHGGVREQLNALLPVGKVPVGDIATMAQMLTAWQKNPPVPKKKTLSLWNPCFPKPYAFTRT